ncbi:MAG: 2-succinyl-6-hydroxy-2, 4-cyclohexadiene-1-carboxylate synthase [Candidatus Celerinatantimonas neptuna]|nr:MAG: 2-succinyl-6-hydroxy-2, 4-cyclohexadiene-1-carboxylate synthase [Candidatus Celerinatantimonas neptuna]
MNEYFINHLNTWLRYHDLPGDKTPVVFIHGLGCASSFDYPQVASTGQLTNHRRILIDLLGAGFSDKPEIFSYTIQAHADYLETFLNDLQLEQFYLYGHSRGGSIATELASRFKSKLAGLILSESNLDSGGGMFSQHVTATSEPDYLHEGHQQLIGLSRKSGEYTGRCWAATLATSQPLAVYRESASLIKGTNPTWRDILYALKIPKTYLFGADSQPDPDVQVLAHNGINIGIIPHAGHSIAWENPKGLANAIIDAMNTAENMSR